MVVEEVGIDGVIEDVNTEVIGKAGVELAIDVVVDEDVGAVVVDVVVVVEVIIDMDVILVIKVLQIIFCIAR